MMVASWKLLKRLNCVNLDQLTRTDNAYRRLLLTAMPALTLNLTCDKRPEQVYVCSSQLSQSDNHII